MNGDLISREDTLTAFAEDDGIEGLLSIKYPYCHCGAKMESEG